MRFQARLQADQAQDPQTKALRSKESLLLKRGMMKSMKIFKRISLTEKWTCLTTACKALLRWESRMVSQSVSLSELIGVLTLWR